MFQVYTKSCRDLLICNFLDHSQRSSRFECPNRVFYRCDIDITDILRNILTSVDRCFVFGILIMSRQADMFQGTPAVLPHLQHLCLSVFISLTRVGPHQHPASHWKHPSIIQSTYYVFPMKIVSSEPLLISTLPLNSNFLSSVQGCLCKGRVRVRCLSVNPCKAAALSGQHWVYLSS